MKVIIDMNLSPAWVTVLGEDGQSAVHWSSIGSLSAEDCEILAWAREHQHILFTHDLDFGAILAATYADTPRRSWRLGAKNLLKKQHFNG